MRAPVLALSLVLIAARASAQAPVVTPQGDPSVKSDTIYALAGKPADYPEESTIVLLDDGIVVQNADGTGTTTYRTVAQVLNREAVEGLSELTFTFDGVKERFRLNWARVVKPDGTVVSEKPMQEQTTDVPVPQQSPVYTDMKRVRVSLGGVEAGTIVDYSYTTEKLSPILPDDFSSSWTITTGRTIRRSRLIMDVPVGYGLKVTERHLTHPAKVTQRNGRRVMEWTAADLPYVQPERFVDTRASELYEGMRFAGPLTWEKLGVWYAGLARDRYRPDPEVFAAADQVTAGQSSDRAKLEALHKWVAQEFRYISLSLGQGGYQPRLPLEVLHTKSGDCKDKATLFVLLARHLGFEAYPVLLNSGGGVDAKLPSMEQLNHEIAAVKLDGAWTYLDLTADLVPFGEIPGSYQGEFGLIVFDDGKVEQVTFPTSAPKANRFESRIAGEVMADGTFTGTAESSAAGALQYELRGVFSADLTDRDRGQLANAMVGNIFQGARGDNLVGFDGRDLRAEVKFHVDVRADRVLQKSGSGWVFRIPLLNAANPSLVTQLEEELSHRKQPISVSAVWGPTSIYNELILTIPDGWVADLPEGVVVEGVWGRYEANYAQDGRSVKITREVTGARGTQPKEALPDLIRWMKAIGQDDVGVLTLHPGD